MLPVVVIALSVALLVTLVFFVFAFFEVALTSPGAAAVRKRVLPEWQPPIVQNEELFAWAASAAKRAVQKHLPKRRGAAAAKAIVADLGDGTDHALTYSPNQVKRRGQHACSSCRNHLIGVTIPEVLTIADALQSKRTAEDLRNIRVRAVEAAKRAISMDSRAYEAAKIDCPLLCADSTCAANGFRPIQCRGWRPLDRSNKANPQGGEGIEVDPHALLVSQGVEEGLMSELGKQGLDGARYDLSSALVVALDTPGAAESWAAGQPVFAGCKKQDSPRPRQK